MAEKEKQADFSRLRSEAAPLAAPGEATDLRQWLRSTETGEEDTRDAGLEFLLATTYSEVIWGKREGNGWILSNRAAMLPAGTLVDLRAFGPEAEIFVWRDATGLHARRRTDGKGTELDTMEETQLLWGREPDDKQTAPAGFTLLRDGDEGLRHAPPLVLDDSYFDRQNGHRPARLVLRHYIGRDDVTGVARVVDSRLVAVERVKPPAN